MAVTPERHEAIRAELTRMKRYMESLAIEIEAAAPMTDKRGLSWLAAIQLDSALTHLQRRLKEEQERQLLLDRLRGK
jgi:hypothetical protein